MSELTATPIDEEVEQQNEASEEAPYGYKADGTPRKKPGRQKGSIGGGRKRSFDNLREPLADRIVEYIGPPIGFASPLALAVLEDRAEKTADALCTLAATRPRIAKLIQGMIAGSASVDLAMTGVAILTAIAVEVQRVPPDSLLSHYFNIDAFYAEIYGDERANGDRVQARGLISEVE